MNKELMFSSATDLWATPPDFFEELDREFHFNLDPCADDTNHKTPRYFTKEDDGLTKDWGGGQSFLQPSLRPGDGPLGREGLRGRTQARLSRRPSPPGQDGHDLLPRLHPRPERDPLHPRPPEVRRRQKPRALPLDARHLQRAGSPMKRRPEAHEELPARDHLRAILLSL